MIKNSFIILFLLFLLPAYAQLQKENEDNRTFPFKDGEYLHFKVSYGYMLAGYATIEVRENKRVMLFGSGAGERLEPVGVVGGTLFHGPFLHRFGHLVGNTGIEFRTGFGGLLQRGKSRGRQAGFHDRKAKYVFTENFDGVLHFHLLLVRSMPGQIGNQKSAT